MGAVFPSHDLFGCLAPIPQLLRCQMFDLGVNMLLLCTYTSSSRVNTRLMHSGVLSCWLHMYLSSGSDSPLVHKVKYAFAALALVTDVTWLAPRRCQSAAFWSPSYSLIFQTLRQPVVWRRRDDHPGKNLDLTEVHLHQELRDA